MIGHYVFVIYKITLLFFCIMYCYFSWLDGFALCLLNNWIRKLKSTVKTLKQKWHSFDKPYSFLINSSLFLFELLQQCYCEPAILDKMRWNNKYSHPLETRMEPREGQNAPFPHPSFYFFRRAFILLH